MSSVTATQQTVNLRHVGSSPTPSSSNSGYVSSEREIMRTDLGNLEETDKKGALIRGLLHLLFL